MRKTEILKKIEELKIEIDQLSDSIENFQENKEADESWNSVYSKSILLLNSANKVKVQIKNKTI